MKSSRSLTAALAALVVLIFSAAAIAGPFEAIPDGFRLGGVYIVTAASDTLYSTVTVPAGARALKTFTPKSITKATSGIGGLVTLPAQKADGVIMAAKKPFRFRTFIAGGMTTGSVYVPVDTVSAANVKYPCRVQLFAAIDSTRLKPATSDTIWVGFLLRD